jgi:hypothetical protein
VERGVHKLRCIKLWAWHSPNHRREQVQLCLINFRLELAQPLLQKWVRCSTAVFPLMFKFREKRSQVRPDPENYKVMLPPPRTATPPLLPPYIINLLEVVCLHLSTQPTWPQLYACLVSCLLSFSASPVTSVRFLGQARVGHERWHLKTGT